MFFVVGMCRYMKGDLDSYLALPNIRARLQCFDPNEDFYLGVLSIMIGFVKNRPFASGGPGYMFSRGLMAKFVHWSPICLLMIIQRTNKFNLESVN